MSFFLSLISLKRILSQTADFCPFSICEKSFIGDGLCDVGCNNILCDFDSANNSPADSDLRKFQVSDCYAECKLTGCTDSLLDNNQCDPECDNAYCGFDLGKCGICDSGCTKALLFNSQCDQACKSMSCEFDNQKCGFCNEGCFETDLAKTACPNAKCKAGNCEVIEETQCFQQCSPGCSQSMKNDSICDQQCNNAKCAFDAGDCLCALGCTQDELQTDCKGDSDPCNTKKCGFKNGKCKYCASGCLEDMIGNGICDQQCFNQACSFDDKDCQCSEGCIMSYENLTWTNVSSNQENEKCFVRECLYNTENNPDGFKVRRVIMTNLLYNNYSLQVLDDSSTSCPLERLQDLDKETTKNCSSSDPCYNKANLWCMGRSSNPSIANCLMYSGNTCLIYDSLMFEGQPRTDLSACPLGYSSYPKINELFAKDPSNLQLCLPTISNHTKSSPNTYFVAAANPPTITGVGSSISPFNSLYFAMTQVYSDFSKLILKEGNFLFQFSSLVPLMNRSDPYNPLYFDSVFEIKSIVIQGENPENPSKVIWTHDLDADGSWKVLKISSKAKFLHFANLRFEGSGILTKTCTPLTEICYYCPSVNYFYTLQKGWVLGNDRKQHLDDSSLKKINEQEEKCLKFENFNFFELNQKTFFENVTFYSFRMKFKTLIRTSNSLSLKNVRFQQVQPKAGGNVLEVTCSASCETVDFNYTEGNVTELNPGYEVTETIETGSFLSIRNIRSVTLDSLSASYNFIYSNPRSFFQSYFIRVVDFNGTFSVLKSNFSNIYANFLIYVDVRNLQYDKLNKDALGWSQSFNQQHFLMSEVQFANIYTSGGFVDYQMKSCAHNINISQVLLDHVLSGQSAIIKLEHSGTLKKTDWVGSRVTFNGEKALVNRRQVVIDSLAVKASVGEYFLEIHKNANLLISNIFVESFNDRSYQDVGRIIQNFRDKDSFTISPGPNRVHNLSCEGVLKIVGSYNVSVFNNSVTNSFCRQSQAPGGLIITGSEGFLNISMLVLKNVSLAATSLYLNDLDHFVYLEKLNFNLIEDEESVLKINKCSNISIKNLFFNQVASKNSSPAKISAFFQLNLTEFFINDTSSKTNDGGFLSLIASSEGFSTIHIEKGEAVNVSASGNGGFLKLDCQSDKQRQSLTLKNIRLRSISANDGVFLHISNKISFSQSAVSNIEVDSSSGKFSVISDFHRNGCLALENVLFSNNRDLSTSGIAGFYQETGNLLKINNLTIENCENSTLAFEFRGVSHETILEFSKVFLLNLKNFDARGDGFLLNAVSLQLRDSVISNLSGFIIVANSAKAEISGSTITKTTGFVAEARTRSVFQCKGCLISENSGTIITASSGSQVYLSNTQIINNVYRNSAVFILSLDSRGGSSNTITDSIIQNNSAVNAEMIKFMNTDVIIINSKFFNNQVESFLYTGMTSFNTSLKLSNCQFSNQSSLNYGSFLYALAGSSVSIFDSKFESGSSGIDGGAVYVSNCFLLSISNSTFLNNRARNAGAAVYSVNTQVSVENSKFLTNKAATGVDLYLLNKSFSISQSTFAYSQCFSSSHCESIWASGTDLELSVIKMTDTSFPVSGVQALNFRRVSVLNSTFTRLKGTEFGALRLHGGGFFGKVLISGSKVEENSSEQFGGGLLLDNMDLLVQDSLFWENSAGDSGGAMHLTTPDCLTCSFEITGRTELVGNKASRVGGGINWHDYKPTIGPDILLLNNSALYGSNFASKPATLQHTRRMMQEISENFTVSFKDVSPGQVFNQSFLVGLTDTYNSLISVDNSSVLILEPGSLSIMIQGKSSFTALNGTFDIKGFIPRAAPGTNQTIRLYTNSITSSQVRNDETVYKNDLIVQLSLRPCQNGERIGETYCAVCPELRYLIRPAQNCKDCPTGANCTGGDKVWVKKGFYRTSYWSEIFYPCPVHDACLGNTEGFLTKCSEGYTGIACAVCKSGYIKNGLGNCSKCPSPAAFYFITGGILLAIFVVSAVLIRSSIKSAFVNKAKHSIYIKIFTNYLQLVFLTTQFNLAWPDYVMVLFGIQKSAATFTDYLFSVECYFSESSEQNLSEIHYSKMIFYACLPVVIFCISAIVWIGICMTRGTTEEMKRELPLTMIVLFFLVYPNIVKFMFSNFSCTHFDMLGKFISDNFSVECWSRDHAKYSLYVALPSIILWSVGVPTLVLIIMIKRRNLLHKTENKIVFGFIYNGYKTSIFYWEFIIMYRKILIICVIVFIAEVSAAVQGLTVALILSFCLFIQYEVGPYNSEELNHMEIEALITATITIYCGLFYLTKDLGQALQVILFITIVLCNSYFLILWLYWMSKALVDLLASFFPAIRFFFKKGDAFEDEFTREEIVVTGSFFDAADGKRHYTLFTLAENEQKRFDVWSIPELYVRVMLQKDEFSGNLEEFTESEENSESLDEKKSQLIVEEAAKVNILTPKFKEFKGFERFQGLSSRDYRKNYRDEQDDEVIERQVKTERATRKNELVVSVDLKEKVISAQFYDDGLLNQRIWPAHRRKSLESFHSWDLEEEDDSQDYSHKSITERNTESSKISSQVDDKIPSIKVTSASPELENGKIFITEQKQNLSRSDMIVARSLSSEGYI